MTTRIATADLTVALQAEAPAGELALCAAMPLPEGPEAPEWIHLLPKGPLIHTYDGRGPYRLEDAASVARASLEAAAERGAVLDENHATDKAAPEGLPAPARGWIVAFEAREDGIWGKIDWNASGKALMADRAYRGISPALLVDKATGRVAAILRASLINKPNLRGLATLHMENDMNLLAELAKKLGLADGASQEAVIAAVDALKTGTTALQGQLGAIAKAAGAKDGATHEEVLGAVGELATRPAASGDAKTVEALQGELADVTKRFNALDEQTRRDKATAFVDAAIKDKRVGVTALRDHYIAMHMQDPARVEKEINAFPVLGRSHTSETPPANKGAGADLSDADRQVMALMGVSEEEFKKIRAAEGQAEEIA